MAEICVVSQAERSKAQKLMLPLPRSPCQAEPGFWVCADPLPTHLTATAKAWPVWVLPSHHLTEVLQGQRHREGVLCHLVSAAVK